MVAINLQPWKHPFKTSIMLTMTGLIFQDVKETLVRFDVYQDAADFWAWLCKDLHGNASLKSQPSQIHSCQLPLELIICFNQWSCRGYVMQEAANTKLQSHKLQIWKQCFPVASCLKYISCTCKDMQVYFVLVAGDVYEDP